MHQSLQGMLDAAHTVQASREAADRAFAEAVGVAGDHPDTPSVLAAVSRNRLVLLEIDESVLEYYRNDPNAAHWYRNDPDGRAQHPDTALAVHVNTVIRGAFANWRAEVARLMRA